MSRLTCAVTLLAGGCLVICLGCGVALPVLDDAPPETGGQAGQPVVSDEHSAPTEFLYNPADAATLKSATQWQAPLAPVFEQAGAVYSVPVDLLVTLAKVGSGFENRGAASTIEGGYGLMALRDNDLGGDSLATAAGFLGVSNDELIADPATSILGAAAVLNRYAEDAGIDRSQGIEAWLPAVVEYAGLDEEDSKFFAMGVYELIQMGFAVTNSYGESFSVESRMLEVIDLESLVPPGVKRIPLSALEQGLDPDTIGAPAKDDRLAVDYPGAVWDPAASCNYSTTVTGKDTIVIHTIEGSAAGCRSWFKNCAAQTSAHYVVSEAGGVWQMVEERYTAWHVGCLNSRSIGIEHEGYAGSSSHPASLYNASALLCRNICDRRGIVKAHRTCAPGILGHIDANNCHCGGTHWDPGGGWNWTYFINQINGTNYRNPPYLFGDGPDGWTAGNGTPAMYWIAPPSWGGAMYFDQTGNDCFVYSPTTNISGPWAPQTLNVDFYPQSGTSAAHDLQVFWKTNASNVFTAAKSSPVVSYNAQSRWVTMNLNLDNSNWWGQTINQLRLDFDNTNHGNRWIVNHVVLQDAFWWHFGSDTMGWTAGHSLTTPWHTASTTWLGALVTDQTGNDGYLYSPTISGGGWPYNYLGGENDWISVHVYPQSGNSAIHDMAVYWITSADGTWNEAKSTHVTYTGQSQWVTVNLPVGLNANWPAAHITRLRLDFDQSNHGTRWIVDYIRSNYSGADNTAPSVPGGVNATVASQTQVNLSWAASSDGMGVNGYKVYRDGAQIGTTIGTSYSDTNCTAATTYSYQVAAYDASGNESAKSTAVSVTTTSDTQAPSVPAGLTATAVSGTQVNLSWAASTDNVGVTGYKIYREGTQIGTNATATYADTTCTPVTTYSYAVSAYDAAGNNSAQSSATTVTTPDTIPPSVPTGLSATAVSGTRVDISWVASSDNVGVTGYKIFRGSTQIGTSATTAYSDTTCTPGTAYSYKVSAYDAAGNNSAQSSAANVTTPDTIAPSAPTALVATAVSTSQINLGWTAATDNVGVAGYDIYRDGAFLVSVTGTSYSNTGLDMGVTYTYAVVAFDAAENESVPSGAADNTTYIIIDNVDSAFTASANWTTGTSAADKYASNYRTRATQAISDTANWYFNIPTADSYEVYAWWTQGADRSNLAPYFVYYDGGSVTVKVNQQAGGGQWNSLGTWNFAVGESRVRLSCWAAAGYTVVADAVLLIRR